MNNAPDFADAAPEVAAAEPWQPVPPPAVPEIAPIPPQPGLPLSIAFVGAFFVGQIPLLILIVIALLFIAGMEQGLESFRGPDAARKITELTKGEAFLTLALVGGTGWNMILALSFSWLMLRGRWRRAMAIRGFTLGQGLLVCLIAPPLYLIVLQVYGWVHEWVPNLGLLDELDDTVSSVPWIAVLIGGCVFPGIGEELFCRGFLGRGLVARWGIIGGSILASLFFGLIHVEPAQAIYAAVIGMVLQLIYLSTKSLLAPMLLHTLNNTIAFFLHAGADLYPNVHDRIHHWDEQGQIPPLLITSAFIAVGGLLVLFYLMRTRWFMPDGRPWSPGYATAEMPPLRVKAVAHTSWPRWWGVLLGLAAYGTFLGALFLEFRDLLLP